MPDKEDCDPAGATVLRPGEDSWNAGELPPAVINGDERRLQMIAYRLWSGLLGDAALPLIGALDPGGHPSLAPHGVVLDFSRSPSDPHIVFLGPRIAAECGIAPRDGVSRVSQLPKRSLLERIADRYFEAGPDHEPLGFEAEFVNQRDRTILYRGILLPFSRGGGGADFVFAVISWKEVAGAETVGELLLELGQVIDLPRPNMPRSECRGDMGGAAGNRPAGQQSQRAAPARSNMATK